MPFIEETRLDTRVLLFTMAVSIVTSCLFGLAPPSPPPAPISSISSGSPAAGCSAEAGASRRILVFAQVALATVLLVMAGLDDSQPRGARRMFLPDFAPAAS